LSLLERIGNGETNMRRTLNAIWNGMAGFGWLVLIAVVGPSLLRTEPVDTSHDQTDPAIEAAPLRPPVRRASINRPVAVAAVDRPEGVVPPARRITIESPEDVSFPEPEFIPVASWDVFRPWAQPDRRPADGFRFFKLPEPPSALPPTRRGDPMGPRSRELSQARYDNEEARYNIRESLNRLEKVGIKVVLNWNETYGTESPVVLRACLDENWELRWRQTQLNALMEGTPLPKYTPRQANLGRVVPVGWKQCGSGVCNPGNPYCPYSRGGD
jgi:hypothetical protein